MTRRFKEPAQLHNHSKGSLLDAVPSAQEWVDWCLENNTPGFAITDHGTAISMYDAVRFPEYIANYNKRHNTDHPPDAVVGIPAVELYVKLAKEDRSHHHITVWACSKKGYYNLMKLSSIAYDDTVSYFGSIKARVTFDQILQYKEGLKFGTGCIAGPIGSAIIRDDNFDLAEERFVQYCEMFGDDLYIEFHPTDITHDFNKKTGGFDKIAPTECACDGNMQLAYNKFLTRMIDKYGDKYTMKPIPVTDAHFVMPEDKIIQDCLLKNGNSNGWYFYESYHQKRADEIYGKLKDQLGDWLTEEYFEEWIENTYEVMNAAATIKIEYEYHLPEIEIPSHIKEANPDGTYDEHTYDLLLHLCKAHGRWRDEPEYIERFNEEIDVIRDNKEMNFIPYFLLYEDISSYARSQGILQGIARGSAGGSIVSYYLKIIHFDPIECKLPFERFLSHPRIAAKSFPDIDGDFGNRTKITKYLQEKYGLGYAQIATFQKMKIKNAIKDSMWAIYGRNREDPEVKSVCMTIPDSPQGIDEMEFVYGFTDKEGEYHKGLVEENELLANFFKNYPDVEKMSKRLIGLTRGWGRHASAYVVSTLDLAAQRVPTMKMFDKASGEFVTVTQFDAKQCENVGLVKADLLGVTTIEAVSECIELIKQRHGIDYLEEDDKGVALIYRLPEDPAVFKDFYAKKTDSSFQFGTPTIKGGIQEFNPQSKQDLADMTALYRPGAMDAIIVNEHLGPDDGVSATQYYMDVKNGKRPLSYVHPDMAKYTTNGVLVYQEQVMEFLTDWVGYTKAESDVIRGAIAKKKASIMMETFDKIRETAKVKGWTPEQADTMCQQVQAFSKYSFNRSHSRAYGDLGYITMFMKHHHPTDWWCAVLNVTNRTKGKSREEKMRFFMTLLGDWIKPPSVDKPSRNFEIRDERDIVAPISSLKRVGPKSVDELVNAGPFTDLDDYLEKVRHNRVNMGHFGAMVKGRAVDCFMDKSKPYWQARTDLLNEYQEKRKCKPFPPEMYALNPLSVFLMEKDINQCFNKSLLGDKAILKNILAEYPEFRPTTTPSAPIIDSRGTPILADLRVAEFLVKQKHKDQVGMILLYGGSSYKKIHSKKTGKAYNLVEITLSDGINDIIATQWDKTKALGWQKGSMIYVKGKLAKGFKTAAALTVNYIECMSEG